jgi:hypothetical protein
MPLQGGLCIERMRQLVQVSRSGFYRYLRGGWPDEEETTVRAAVHCRIGTPVAIRVQKSDGGITVARLRSLKKIWLRPGLGVPPQEQW